MRKINRLVYKKFDLIVNKHLAVET